MVKIISIALFAITLALSVFFGMKYIDEQVVVQNAPHEDFDKDNFISPSYDDIKVTLVTDENCAVISKNPINAKIGDTVSFELVFNENYIFKNTDSDKAVFEKNILTVKDCTADVTVSVFSECTARTFEFDVDYPDTASGTVRHNVLLGSHMENSIITVTALPAEGQTFIGWSLGDTIVNSAPVLSYSESYSFTLKDNIKLYPNFLTEGYTIVKYNLMGGTTSDGTTDVILTQFSPKNHRLPNALADDGTIVRPGYTLLEYTKAPESDSEAVCPGGLFTLPKEGSVLELYCQWSEWTPATYFRYNLNTELKTAEITGFVGDFDELSIPAEIEGCKVTKIASNAILNKSFERLVIPSSVVTIESGAFSGCPNFNTLYITDSFTSIPNDVFVNCNKFKNLRLNASLPPSNVTHAENIGLRLEVLLTRTDDKPLILFVGGSSCLYGIKSEYLESKLDYKYHVLNCGTNAGGTGILYLEGLAPYLRENDIIVNVPEYGANQMGGTEIVWRTLRATVSCYNIYRNVDFSKFTNFFQAVTEYNTLSEARPSFQTYDTKNPSLAENYCDLVGTRAPNETPNFTSTSVKASSLTDSAIARINALYADLTSRGIKYYYSCAPICDNQSKGVSSAANVEAYYQKALNSLDCPVISNPANYRFDQAVYFNSNYHLCTDAAITRTDKVYADLLAQFEKEN